MSAEVCSAYDWIQKADRRKLWTVDTEAGVESHRESEIPRLSQMPRDMSENSNGLNTDPWRIQTEGEGEKPKDTKKEESRRFKNGQQTPECGSQRVLGP